MPCSRSRDTLDILHTPALKSGPVKARVPVSISCWRQYICCTQLQHCAFGRSAVSSGRYPAATLQPLAVADRTGPRRGVRNNWAAQTHFAFACWADLTSRVGAVEHVSDLHNASSMAEPTFDRLLAIALLAGFRVAVLQHALLFKLACVRMAAERTCWRKPSCRRLLALNQNRTLLLSGAT